MDGFGVYAYQDVDGTAPIVDECGGHFGPVDETGKVLYHYHRCQHIWTFIIALIYIRDELFSARILFKMWAEFGGHQQNRARCWYFFKFSDEKKADDRRMFQEYRILDVIQCYFFTLV